MTTLKNMSGEIIGIVTAKNWRTALAPSIRAASYRDAGTFFSAAR